MNPESIKQKTKEEILDAVGIGGGHFKYREQIFNAMEVYSEQEFEELQNIIENLRAERNEYREAFEKSQQQCSQYREALEGIADYCNGCVYLPADIIEEMATNALNPPPSAKEGVDNQGK